MQCEIINLAVFKENPDKADMRATLAHIRGRFLSGFRSGFLTGTQAPSDNDRRFCGKSPTVFLGSIESPFLPVHGQHHRNGQSESVDGTIEEVKDRICESHY